MGPDLYCSFCRKSMEDGEAAYGMTRGRIDNDVEGFRMGMDDDWDIYCPDCMNIIDKLMGDYMLKSRN